ncbi:hypothetical protein CPLU01_02672 [Colletotrichum plurivorum]|uniref:Uncharacterized protein n=1 Tax=Colletotrichum plurivorum TaxID=2175906 RepID=A0A8H6KUU4_9PEZI|nr:hypothetical protein CPLU01_02672 [Colletotrichum plurivorum]
MEQPYYPLSGLRSFSRLRSGEGYSFSAASHSRGRSCFRPPASQCSCQSLPGSDVSKSAFGRRLRTPPTRHHFYFAFLYLNVLAAYLRRKWKIPAKDRNGHASGYVPTTPHPLPGITLL